MNDTFFSSVAFRRTHDRAGSVVRRGALAACMALLLVLAGLAPPAARAEGMAMYEQVDSSAEVALWRDGRCAADAFVRTELFFGLSRPGGVVTEEEFKSFVDGRVTPLFPAGLTVVSGVGQFRDSTGTIVSEGSKVLILLYAANDEQADRRIQRIRALYKRQFEQRSVLRADDSSCVSF